VNRRVLACLGLVAMVGACTPTASPTPEPQPPAAPQIVACVGLPDGQCNAIAVRVKAILPAARGLPARIEIVRASCDGPPCVPGDIAGQATAEWVDGGNPVTVSFMGAAAALRLDVVEGATWSGVVTPRSARVAPGAAVPFTLGHCGLLHVVDFDGSFWVVIGQLDPDAPEVLNAVEGQMRLVAPNRAQFSSGGKLIATLARWVGPKHFWLCD
jgi:hypothetical protein